MRIKCEWVLSNNKDSEYMGYTPKELLAEMELLLSKIEKQIKEYSNTDFKRGRVFLIEWDKSTTGQCSYEDVRASFIISKQGRKGIKEREIYSEVNSIKIAYFTKLKG